MPSCRLFDWTDFRALHSSISTRTWDDNGRGSEGVPTIIVSNYVKFQKISERSCLSGASEVRGKKIHKHTCREAFWRKVIHRPNCVLCTNRARELTSVAASTRFKTWTTPAPAWSVDVLRILEYPGLVCGPTSFSPCVRFKACGPFLTVRFSLCTCERLVQVASGMQPLEIGAQTGNRLWIGLCACRF